MPAPSSPLHPAPGQISFTGSFTTTCAMTFLTPEMLSILSSALLERLFAKIHSSATSLVVTSAGRFLRTRHFSLRPMRVNVTGKGWPRQRTCSPPANLAQLPPVLTPPSRHWPRLFLVRMRGPQPHPYFWVLPQRR